MFFVNKSFKSIREEGREGRKGGGKKEREERGTGSLTNQDILAVTLHSSCCLLLKNSNEF